MKQFVNVLFVCLVLFSCKKNEEEITSPTSQFTAKVGSAIWTASDTKASIYNGTIVVIGEAIDGTSLTINLNGDSTGIYGLSPSSASTGTYSLGSGKGFSTAGGPDGAGQVLIESINSAAGEITGSFNYDAVRSVDDSLVSITEGRFVKVKYTNLPLGVDNNNLRTDVNGDAWAPIDVSGFVAFKRLHISAFDSDGTRSLSFEIPYDIAPGNYNLNFFTIYSALYITSDERTYYAVSGDLEITSHNLVSQELNATFEIYMEEHEGSGIAKLTNGQFAITYE